MSRRRPKTQPIPERPCDLCAKPTDGALYACQDCVYGWKAQLMRLPGIMADLEVELTRRARKGDHVHVRRAEVPLPYSPAASDLLHEARNLLVTQCRIIALDQPDLLPTDTTTAMVDWLIDRETSVSLRPEGPDMVRELGDWTKRAMRLCDRPAEKKFVKRCLCETELRAADGQETVQCRGCGNWWSVDQLLDERDEAVRDVLAIETGTLRDIHAVLAALRTPRRLETIRAWTKPRDGRPPRLTRQGQTRSGHGLYRYAEAIQLAERKAVAA